MTYLYSLYDALVSVDVPSDKARAVVDAMERGMGTTLATKVDLDGLRVATRADLEMHRAATKADIDSLRASTRADVDSLRTSMKADIDVLRVETQAGLESLRSSLTIRFGAMLVVGLAMLFAALRLG